MMNTIKTLLAVSVLAAAASANAAMYNITGYETGLVNVNGATNVPTATLVMQPYGTAYVPQSIAAAQGTAVQSALNGSLDITGTTINSGSFSLGHGSLLTFLGDYFGTTMNTSAATITFAGGTYSSTGVVEAGSCNGAAAGLVCTSAYAGSPVLDYILADNGGGSYDLKLRLGSLANAQGSLTVQNYHFQATAVAPAVPVPAAAWLFGSGLLGLAGTARRRAARNNRAWWITRLN
jgi:hypothetical protein